MTASVPPKNPLGGTSSKFGAVVPVSFHSESTFGTRQVKFHSVTLYEDGQRAQMIHLTAMQVYMAKSTEELRYEDYKFNPAVKKLVLYPGVGLVSVPANSALQPQSKSSVFGSQQGQGAGPENRISGQFQPIQPGLEAKIGNSSGSKEGLDGGGINLQRDASKLSISPTISQQVKPGLSITSRLNPVNILSQPGSARMRKSPFTKRRNDDWDIIELGLVRLYEEGVILIIEIARQSTVRELKEKVRVAVGGITREQIQLVHRGSRLRDSDYIRDLHLSTGDEVYFIVEPEPINLQKALVPKELLPKLTLIGYTTTPSIVELARMSAEELATVRGFCVQNEYGRIEFQGETDVRGLDIDSIVRIEEKAVIMYPDEKGAPKPPIGKGLNKAARIHLFDCRPKKSIPLELLTAKLRKVSSTHNTYFESYDPDSGEWIFRVNHF